MQNLSDLKCIIKFLSHIPTEKFCALFPTIELFFTHDFSPKLLITVGLFWTNLDIFSSICSCRFVIAICWKLLFLVFLRTKWRWPGLIFSFSAFSPPSMLGSSLPTGSTSSTGFHRHKQMHQLVAAWKVLGSNWIN